MTAVGCTESSMASLWFGTVLSAGLVLGVWGSPVADFDDNYKNYQMIYHHTHHLLVAIHNNNCYFVNVPHSEESQLDNSDWISPTLQYTEESLLSAIMKHEYKSTTLDAMRDKYQDLLADFHCLNHNIFALDFFDHSDSHSQNCLQLGIGDYPVLTDCHSFIHCGSGGVGGVEKCAEGTAWSIQQHMCTFTADVPRCT